MYGWTARAGVSFLPEKGPLSQLALPTLRGWLLAPVARRWRPKRGGPGPATSGASNYSITYWKRWQASSDFVGEVRKVPAGLPDRTFDMLDEAKATAAKQRAIRKAMAKDAARRPKGRIPGGRFSESQRCILKPVREDDCWADMTGGYSTFGTMALSQHRGGRGVPSSASEFGFASRMPDATLGATPAELDRGRTSPSTSRRPRSRRGAPSFPAARGAQRRRGRRAGRRHDPLRGLR